MAPELTYSKSRNKIRRQEHNVRVKSALSSEKRDMRLKRKRAEDKAPELRRKRLAENIPSTIERMRVFDEKRTGPVITISKKDDEPIDPTKLTDEQKAAIAAAEQKEREELEARKQKSLEEEQSLLFPTLQKNPDGSYRMPKVLITTSRFSHMHKPAEELTAVFPNSQYIPRSKNLSIFDIAKIAANPTTPDEKSGDKPRDPYTHLVVINDHHKKPQALTIVVLPEGPTFHFSVSNFVPRKKISNHGNPTDHMPELNLHGFSTPLGKTVSSMFSSMFPQAPEYQGRQVVTLHNQRDFIFFRRHRYVFRESKGKEKAVGYGLDTEDKNKDKTPMDIAVEGIKVGLQEIGPQLTLKLRRLERGLKEEVEWEWKGQMDKDRKKFQL
ncbi:Brix-domain-containing protein [Ascobolus immersus RN42]|uniref:Brix-domain-containing protein n=1 Tax=Ascobolus immersus RN42 TaxID=1160509 RepID=A0A3N4HKR8_ASCIM|nr:Brix-domain-containing protein [Ascobolus immersus RN42]